MTPAKSKPTRLGLMIVVGVLAVLAFILVTALTVFYLFSYLTAVPSLGEGLITGRSPLDVERIDPALALALLGGVPESDVVTDAIEKARPETAFAAAFFQPELNDSETAGAFLLLAPIYAENGQKNKSLFCYQMAGNVATLSPDLPSTARADLFFQISNGLMDLDEPVLAKFYLDQAFILATRSPFLQTVHRRGIFEQLQRDYIALNERELARTSLDLSANPPNVEFIPGEPVLLPKGQPVILPTALQEAETNRWLKAQELAALLVERGGHAPPAAYEALETALIAEDAEKLQFLDEQLATEGQISRRIDLIVAKIGWLSLKHQIARKGFGLTLVPEWEEQAEQIRANLTKSYEALFAAYADLIVALPTASQIDKATEEKLRREVLAGELGRYPNYPEQQRQKQLLDMTRQLINSQPELNVFIGVGQVEDRELYKLISPVVINEQ